MGASALAPFAGLVVVVVVGVLLDVEDVLEDVLVVALLSVLEVGLLSVVVVSVEVSAVGVVVVVGVLLELVALVSDEIGVSEVFAGTGIV